MCQRANSLFPYILLFFLFASITTTAQQLEGRKLRITVHSEALAGNLIGDSPDREVSIYLPPGYDQNTEKRYPVLYMLHGYTDRDDKWFGFQEHWIDLPSIVDSAITAGVSREMLIVMPNAYNTFKGSMYSSSITIGDWETFVTRELVEYIDQHYRTISDKSSRGLAGHSMGGYGTMRLGMKYPDVYSSIYLLSPCCLSTMVNDNAGLIKNVQSVKSKDEIEAQPFMVAATLATAASWAPNPNKAPLYLDLPFSEGGVDEEVKNRLAANAPLNMLDQYVYNLKRLDGIAMDAGTKDFGIYPTTKELHERLEAYDLPHFYESYDGDHLNRIGERIYEKVLPFFSEKLKFE